jgi:hypothetical protein
MGFPHNSSCRWNLWLGSLALSPLARCCGSDVDWETFHWTLFSFDQPAVLEALFLPQQLSRFLHLCMDPRTITSMISPLLLIPLLPAPATSLSAPLETHAAGLMILLVD